VNKDRAREIADFHYPSMGWTTKVGDEGAYVCSVADFRVDRWDVQASVAVAEEVWAALVVASQSGSPGVSVAVEADNGDWCIVSSVGLVIADDHTLPFEPKFREPR
jgi:hypothetical protein